MGKNKLWLGICVILLSISVLPVVANKGVKEKEKITVSANEVLSRGEEIQTQAAKSYIKKDSYWKFNYCQEELEQSGISTLPASYDSRKYGYVTATKDQGYYGTCWAFATIAAAESSLIKQGLADQAIDLSEYHLAYFSYAENVDPLKNTQGDYYLPHYTLAGKLGAGGSVHDAMEQLAKWGGPVDEEKAPYTDALNLVELDAKLAFESKYHLKNTYYADTTNRDSIKRLVFEYGATSVAYYFDYTQVVEFQDENAYYLPNVTVPDHAICIIGWDDNYKKENFKITPPGNGAWLCKDSATSNNQYVWISYYTPISDVVAVEFEDTVLLDNNYQFDGCVAGTSSYADVAGKNNQAKSFMNVFEAKASEEYLEELEAVSIHVNGNETYYITVYVNPVINSNGKIMDYTYKSAPIECKAGEYAGIRKVEMKEPIYLNEGDKFSVEVSGTDMENYAVSSSPLYGCEAMNPGECFVGTEKNGEIAYKDLANGNCQATPRIKAFTKDTDIPCATGILLDEQEQSLVAGESWVLKASVIVPAGGLTGVTFYSTNPAVATVAANGEVTAHTEGSCEIIAQCTYGNAKKSCKIQVNNVLANSLETEPTVNLIEGEKYTLTSILDAKATVRVLDYISENPAVATVDKNGKIEALSPGSTKIHVKTIDGSQLTAVCLVNVDAKMILSEKIHVYVNPSFIKVGQTANLVVSMYPEAAGKSKVLYLVSDPTVVSVEGNVVKALAPGTACITVKVVGSDVFASTNIQVYTEETSGKDVNQPEEKVTEQKVTEQKIGTCFQYKNLKYKITGNEQVAVTGATKKSVKRIWIPNFVKYQKKIYYVTTVSNKSFYGYKKLKTVKIGKNVKSIGKNAFSNCKKLKSVTILSSVLTKAGKNSFAKTNEKLVLKVPKKKLQAYKKIFKKAGLSKRVTWKKK